MLTYNMLRAVTVSLRRHARLLLEERAEARRIGEVEVVGYLGHGLVRAVEQRHGAARYGLEHQFLHGVSAHRLRQFGQVFGREEQLVGVERRARPCNGGR